MPTYTYACRDCGQFDLLRAICGRDELASCPHCGDAATRVFAAPHLARLDPSVDRMATSAGLSAEAPHVTRAIPTAAGRSRKPVGRPGYPPLPRS